MCNFPTSSRVLVTLTKVTTFVITPSYVYGFRLLIVCLSIEVETRNRR